jgi:NO-binding membrane sensor protein with MHYT domain
MVGAHTPCDVAWSRASEIWSMAEIHHFGYGWFNPVMAFAMAFLGSLLGLVCTTRARAAAGRARRSRWLVLAAISIGGGGIWLMHFMAMLGFDIPATQVRYDLPITFGSMAIAIGTVGIGLHAAGSGSPSTAKTVLAGVFTGGGVCAMHYTGMAAMNLPGSIHYDQGLLIASIIIAIVAATTALWFTLYVRGMGAIIGASVIMAIAVCGMHYTAMAAMRVTLITPITSTANGVTPSLLVVPIFIVAAAVIVGTFTSALQAMTSEEFGNDGPSPVRIPAQRTRVPVARHR